MAKKAKGNDKFVGQIVAVAGQLQHWYGKGLQCFLKAFGGRLSTDINERLTCLVIGHVKGKGISPEEKKANELNEKKVASILILPEARFNQLARLTLDEFVSLARSGEKGVAILKSLHECSHMVFPASLERADLHSLNLDGLRFPGTLTGVDLRGSSLRGRHLGASFDRCRMEGADIRELYCHGLTQCRAAKLNARKVRRVEHIDGTDITDANFEHADLNFFGGTGVTAKRSNWTAARVPFAELKDSDFTQALMATSDWQQSKFTDTNFAKANWRKAKLWSCEFQACDFSGADLSGCNLEQATFTHCNLSRATLRGANLFDATFKDCILSKTDFTGARVFGVTINNDQVAKLIGFDVAATKVGRTLGPSLKMFDSLASKYKSCQTSAVVEDQTGAHAVSAASGQWTALGGVSGQMLRFARLHPGGTIQPNSIRFAFSGLKIPRKEAEPIVFNAWYEAFNCATPAACEDNSGKKAESQALWVRTLRTTAGVQKWNKAKDQIRVLGIHLKKADLSGCELQQIHLGQIDCTESNLTNANLNKANAYRCKLSRSNLSGAKCAEANFNHATLSETDLTDAYLGGSWFRGCNMKGAICRRADFAGARLGGADLRGADLTDAKLDEADIEYAKYDENTKLPAGFIPPTKMRWLGKGQSPAFKVLVPSKPAGPMDLGIFVKRLEESTDTGKLAKALAMLKTDSFRLYSEVNADHLAGVVKSQSDPDLVYSCKLEKDGTYACCTQNLNMCGGLRGSLCKHVLVLVVGPAKAREIDPNTIDTWVFASKGQKPLLDKDAMSETFLRYKGAEAGEVDWRPTETIPEDYYAM